MLLYFQAFANETAKVAKNVHNKKGNAVGIPSQDIKTGISKSGVVKKDNMKSIDGNGKVVKQITKEYANTGIGSQQISSDNKFKLYKTGQSNLQSARDLGFDAKMADGDTDVGSHNVQNKSKKRKNRKTKKSKADKTKVEAKHGNKPVPEEQKSDVANRRYFGIF